MSVAILLSSSSLVEEACRAQSESPSSSSSTSTSRDGCASIHLDQDVFDFGKVEEGFPVNHTFSITNNGGTALKLHATATCGCTMVKLEKSELAPGESTKLAVTIDTSMKQDAVTKEVVVDSNDRVHPKLRINLKMLVEDPHRAMGKDGGTKIFTDQHCASCHVAKGEGKLGRDLFNADCAMCHGPKAEGAVGPALFGPYKKDEFNKFMRTVIEEGSKTHRSMPGFAKEHGGPLTKKQVDSIVQYLAGLSSAHNF